MGAPQNSPGPGNAEHVGKPFRFRAGQLAARSRKAIGAAAAFRLVQFLDEPFFEQALDRTVQRSGP
jgi:hypothetical protein